MAVETFSHDAMKTTFTFRLRNDDPARARQVAANCATELDAIESKLSRYFPGSDVWQINQMEAGEQLFIDEWTYDCLRLSFDLYVETGGLFDITLGRKIEHRKNREEGPVPELAGRLMLDPDRPAIYCEEPGREIDLGGIGKGFALDRLREMLDECGIGEGLLSAGASTHLAFGESGWTIELPNCRERNNYELRGEAISASGTIIQGSHLVSSGPEIEPHPYVQVWVVETNAARADAWSTAAMLLSEAELAEVRRDRVVLTAGS